jgi:hypothetical protein
VPEQFVAQLGGKYFQHEIFCLELEKKVITGSGSWGFEYDPEM